MSTASEPQSVRNALATKQGGWRWIALAVTAVVAAGAAGWHFHERWANVEAGTVGSDAASDSKNSTADRVLVETVKLSEGGITRTSTQIGSVHPYEEADLYAKVSGYLEKLHVNYGDRVMRNQVLAEID